MPRAANPYFAGRYPTDPAWESVGSNLATALFGNPEMAGKQRLQNAQIDNYEASAGYDRSRTAGQDLQNGGARALPGTLGNLARMFAPAPVAVAPPMMAPDAAMPAALPPDLGQAYAEFLGAAGQANGDKVNGPGLAAFLTSMLGTDEQARRSMVGTGHTPGKDFALTPGRADQIAATDDAAKLQQALGVASINNRDDIPVANIHAAASRYGSDRSADASMYGANVREGDGTDVPGLIASMFPGTQFTSGRRTPEHNAEVGGAPNSHHLDGTAQDFVKTPGMTIEKVRAALAGKGVRVVEALDEGDHFHVAWAPPKAGKSAATKADKGIPAGVNPMLDKEVNQQLGVTKDDNGNLVGGPNPKGRSALKSLALKNYRANGGNLPMAVSDAIKKAQTLEGQARGRGATVDAGPPQGAPPIAGARKAPDGNYYVDDPKRPGKYLKVG